MPVWVIALICFLLGVGFGIFLLALLVAGRDN